MWSYSNSVTLQCFSMLKIMGMEPRHQCSYTLIMWCITTAAENILENQYKMQHNNKGNNVTECYTGICI